MQSNHALFSISSKCLLDKHRDLSELLHATVHELRFDEGRRLKDLLEQIQASKENSITSQGHNLAISLACSRMSPASLLAHNSSGLESIRRLRALARRIPEAEQQQLLLKRFSELHRRITGSERQFLLIAEQDHRERLVAELSDVWSDSPDAGPGNELSLPALRERNCEAWTTATSVNFCAKAWPTVPADHEDNPVLHVLARFISNGFLHRTIREQGGAYGSGAGQNSNAAVFRCFSYRDPRLNETLADFDRALDWVLQEKHKDRQLEEAILGVVSAMDKPSSPAGEAKIAFYNNLFGRTLEQRNWLSASAYSPPRSMTCAP